MAVRGRSSPFSDALALETVAGLQCTGAVSLTAVCVIPWQLHRTLSHPHLWTLAPGYLWLVPGLSLNGSAQFAGNIPVTGMLHGIGMGALVRLLAPMAPAAQHRLLRIIELAHQLN